MTILRTDIAATVWRMLYRTDDGAFHGVGNMYLLRKEDRVSLKTGAKLTFTSEGLHAQHSGTIVDYTKGMYTKTDPMYTVLFDGETEVRYILFSDLCRSSFH